jgi:hypothetical protein
MHYAGATGMDHLVVWLAPDLLFLLAAGHANFVPDMTM